MPITRAQAFTETVFHTLSPISGQPCTAWHRAASTRDGGWPTFMLCLHSDDGGHTDITETNLADFHLPADCPLAVSGQSELPPLQGPRDAGGFGPGGCDEAGYDRAGYNAAGFDEDGYDSDGYDENGYDRNGYDAAGYDADGEDQYGRSREPDSYCDECRDPVWTEDLVSVARDSMTVCESCANEMDSCYQCDVRFPDDDLRDTLDDTHVCERCRDNYYTYCDECEGYYHDGDASEHDHVKDDCCCSPQLSFAIRNDGYEPLRNDTRVTISLPAGVISEEGMHAVHRLLVRNGYREVTYGLEAKVGSQVQAKGGNFAKRLSRHAYQACQVKLPPEVLSEAGNIAASQSAGGTAAIEVTRDLNMSAADFYHESSCWWGGDSYGRSRCALKTNGGFGLRTFSTYDSVTGRAWVMPLKQTPGGLRPTFNTSTPDAFVVFNGYGDLEGYAAARIIAHMAGWTYRKITFECSPMFVNGSAGYLVAAEDIAAPYTDGSLYLEVRQHAHLLEDEMLIARLNENETEMEAVHA